MQHRSFARSIALVTLFVCAGVVGACGTSATGDVGSGATVVLQDNSYAIGATESAVFENQSDVGITVDIDCGHVFDQSVNGQWVMGTPHGLCAGDLSDVAGGRQLPFTFSSPTTPGTYRIRFAGTTDRNTGVTVVSSTFVVRP